MVIMSSTQCKLQVFCLQDDLYVCCSMGQKYEVASFIDLGQGYFFGAVATFPEVSLLHHSQNNPF